MRYAGLPEERSMAERSMVFSRRPHSGIEPPCAAKCRCSAQAETGLDRCRCVPSHDLHHCNLPNKSRLEKQAGAVGELLAAGRSLSGGEVRRPLGPAGSIEAFYRDGDAVEMTARAAAQSSASSRFRAASRLSRRESDCQVCNRPCLINLRLFPASHAVTIRNAVRFLSISG